MTGRFAPSPSGRMHLGNIFTALISWLSARKSDGKWILRIEDLDPQRSRMEYARQIEDDLHWLGLDWDEGGICSDGPHAPYLQSLRHAKYLEALHLLKSEGLTYPCYCTRADIMATQAPHESDGRIIYSGKCRPARFKDATGSGRIWGRDTSAEEPEKEHPTPRATRIFVPDEDISFCDKVFGTQTVNLANHCGDFVLRRGDGAWAYQLAVVVDDADMGVDEVVRGCDLLLSSAQQIYLYRLLGQEPPRFAHLPLLCNVAGQRLSKRDSSMSMEAMRRLHTPEEIIGRLAFLAGLTDTEHPVAADELIPMFSWDKIPPAKGIVAYGE